MSSVSIAGDTSGSILLAAPAIAGANTATLPAATGTVMVSGNMPLVMAYAATGTTVTHNTFTKVLFNTELVDTNNCFASSTFTPNVAGYYLLTPCVRLDSNASYESWLTIFKNGVLYRTLVDFSVAQYGIAAPCLVEANGTTDYFEVYAYQNSGSSKTTETGTTNTNFNAHMVRAA